MTLWSLHKLRSITGLLGLVVLCGVPLETPGENKPQTRYQAEAYLLYLFAMYTEWPKEAFPDDRASFVFGILGEDPFGKDIDIIKGKMVKTRNLAIKYFKRVQDIENCQILFISSSEKDHAAEIVKALENSNTLTISEMDGFLDQSGMINISVEKTRAGFGNLKYDINQRAAEKARLRINSYVLAKAGRT